eukprot:1159917-Pelagomonas_calceolata.AAC.8
MEGWGKPVWALQIPLLATLSLMKRAMKQFDKYKLRTYSIRGGLKSPEKGPQLQRETNHWRVVGIGDLVVKSRVHAAGQGITGAAIWTNK